MKQVLIALVCLSAFILLAACGGETPTAVPPTPLAATNTPVPTASRPTATSEPQASNICAQGALPKYITGVVLAKATQGDDFKPVDITTEYDPSQSTFHAVVMLKDAPKNIKLGSAWYLVRAAGYKSNNKIDENELDVADGGTRNVDFTLNGSQPNWPSGSYCVEIYAEGNLALSKNFTVTGDLTPTGATVDVIKQIVLAENTQPSTFEPVNPTEKFQHNIPFIHAAVQIENAPENTVFTARWYPPGQDPLDFQVTTDGTRWIDFQLKQTPTDTPTPEGFPTGEYKVEIYVNDQLAGTKTFTVQ